MNDLISRQFVELVVEYPDPELCTYKEYRGKSYYSIKYIENGETYVGYGTYKPEVLSRYLREYFMPSVQLESAELSGKVWDEWCTGCKEYDQERHCCPRFNRVIRTAIDDAQPERIRGKWIYITDGYYEYFKCDQCEKHSGEPTPFCRYCGADMREDQDEQDNEGNV